MSATRHGRAAAREAQLPSALRPARQPHSVRGSLRELGGGPSGYAGGRQPSAGPSFVAMSVRICM